jgi:transposase
MFQWCFIASSAEANLRRRIVRRIRSALSPPLVTRRGQSQAGEPRNAEFVICNQSIKGTRPRVVRQQQSESAYIFGAVCPRCDTAVGLVLPFANTQTMAFHLEAISLAVPPGRHAVLILDQAGWHTTLKLPQLPNLSLLMLPAGSPELNPAEQVWQQLRDRSLANRCYDNYEQIVDACCDAWNKFTHIPGAIRSLCARSWACLTPAFTKT